jgi:hypothetical protein
MSLDSNNTKLLTTKDAKIKLLTWQFDLRSQQLIDSNLLIDAQKKQIRRQKVQIIVYQAVILASLLALLF